ncbi:MAG: hypothetical protein K8S23_05350 [Candidatus Cloacimonetes bacterium]|nr:hypothetical protein [Candidatus Cloacimonadota bacterium]
MSRFDEINEHFQLNKIRYIDLKRLAVKKMTILRHKFIWFFDCDKDNIEFNGPYYEDSKFKFQLTINFIYVDPNQDNDPVYKKIFFDLFFLTPEANRILFNKKIFPFNNTLEEIFEEILLVIKSDKRIFGV